MVGGGLDWVNWVTIFAGEKNLTGRGDMGIIEIHIILYPCIYAHSPVGCPLKVLFVELTHTLLLLLFLFGFLVAAVTAGGAFVVGSALFYGTAARDAHGRGRPFEGGQRQGGRRRVVTVVCQRILEIPSFS